MHREKYAQKRALELIRQNRERAEITAMLVDEGAATDEVDLLTDRYYKMHRLLQHEEIRQQLKQARMLATSGIVLLAVGLVLTLGSWLIFSGGAFLVYYGLMGIGFGMVLKGYFDKKNADQKFTLL